MILTSTDGTNWVTSFTGLTSNPYSSAVYAGGRWVVVGAGGRIACSTDGGISWQELSSGSPTDSLYGVAYANSTFAITGNRTGTSADGITWNFTANPENLIFNSIAAGSGGFYLPGPQGALYRYAAGSFTRLDSNTSAISRSADFGGATIFNQKLYAVGTGGMVYQSADGTTFTAQPTSTGNDLFAITPYQGSLYAVGAAGTIVSTAEGSSWQTKLTNNPAITTAQLVSVASVNSRLFVGGLGSLLLTSTDGSAWAKLALPANSNTVRSFAYGASYYVAGMDSVYISTGGYTETAMIYSADGATWSRQPLWDATGNVANSVRSIFYDKGHFYYLLSGGQVLRSYGSQPFSGVELVADSEGMFIYGAKLNGGYGGVTAPNGDESRASFAFSYDGKKWLRTELPFAAASKAPPLDFNGKVYLFGSGGTIARSQSGLSLPAPTSGAAVAITGQTGTSITLGAPIAGNEPLTYQWSFNGTPLVGATGMDLTLSNLTGAQAGTYTLTATGTTTGAVATNTVTLTVIPGMPVITLQPLGGTATVGGGLHPQCERHQCNRAVLPMVQE